VTHHVWLRFLLPIILISCSPQRLSFRIVGGDLIVLTKKFDFFTSWKLLNFLSFFFLQIDENLFSVKYSKFCKAQSREGTLFCEEDKFLKISHNFIIFLYKQLRKIKNIFIFNSLHINLCIGINNIFRINLIFTFFIFSGSDLDSISLTLAVD